MQANWHDLYNWLYDIYPTLKFLGFLAGGAYAGFKYGKKVVDWFKDIKTNHLHHIQLSLDDMQKGLTEQNQYLQKNTAAIVDELKALRIEMRDDLRSMTTALIAKK